MEKPIHVATTGLAITDERVCSVGTRQDSVNQTPGGSAFNTLVAFGALQPESDLRFYHTVGDDQRGIFYRESTGSMFGEAHVEPNAQTGVCTLRIAENGEIISGETDYGVATHIKVPDEDKLERRNDLILANINALCRSSILADNIDLLEAEQNQHALLSLSLSGVQFYGASSTQLREVLESLPKVPEVVFASDEELQYMYDKDSLKHALGVAFPGSSVVAITRGEEGSLLRAGNDYIEVPSAHLDPSKVCDVVGAGDAYMGAALARLIEIPYEWNPESIKRAAMLGSFAAAQVVQINQSFLNAEGAQTLRDDYQRIFFR
jgi:sugar/nucleoside kinase (ribokinase family)